MKKIISVFLCIAMIFTFAACSSDKSEANNKNEAESEQSSANPVAEIVIKDYGTITVELRYDKAPNTVKNFIYLANSGFYNGLIFHRVIENFMIQGGDPKGNGTGDPGYSIKGEFSNNGSSNDLKNTRGALAMARSTAYDSAGSQFFICQRDCSWLDGDYAVFGYVTDGLEIVDQIAGVDTNLNDKPYEDVVIEKISVNTYGVSYDEPVTIF